MQGRIVRNIPQPSLQKFQFLPRAMPVSVVVHVKHLRIRFTNNVFALSITIVYVYSPGPR